MAKEIFNLTITDPVGMGWLELREKNGASIKHLLAVNDIAKGINLNMCKYCTFYKYCGGVQYISQPYNRLERINSDGDVELVRSDCPLNGRMLRCNVNT